MPSERQSSLARLLFQKPRSDLALGSLRDLFVRCSECESTTNAAAAYREGRHPSAHPVLRKHLGECKVCQDLYPDLVTALERFDEESLIAWAGLLNIFKTSLELGDEQLKRFMPTEPADYEEPDDYEIELETQLEYSIRPICLWRAVRLGCHLGRFMSAFAGTFAEGSDVWLKWRNGEIQDSISTIVRAIDRPLFNLSLVARNLLLVRSWPTEDEGVLWAPTDGDLNPVEGFVRVDETRGMGAWEEVLGKPPQGLNLGGILFLAHRAATTGVDEFQPRPSEPVSVRELREQLGHIEEMIQTISSSQAEARTPQDAIIVQLEKIALHMESTDPNACEASLLEKLPGVYQKLKPQVRSHLLASEQNYRTPNFAAPGQIIHQIATAFELQLKHSVFAGLFDHLKYRKVQKLRPLPEWEVERRDIPLWSHSAKADNLQLGQMTLLLRRPEPAIREFLDQLGLDCTNIQRALESVYEYRNDATHGTCFDIGTAKAIRADWLHWGERPGGIFAVCFRGE